MKLLLRLVSSLGWFSALVFATAPSLQAGGPIDVYLIGGQSNATGQGYVRNLPKDFKIDPAVLLFTSGKPHLNSGGPAETWIPLRQASESPDRFGPELGFGNRIQELSPGRKIALIKHAHTGTNLYAQWNPGKNAADTAHWGPQFKTFVETVDAGLAALRQQGYQPTLRGMIWQQGENDARPGFAGKYGANLAHLIDRLREQFHAPGLRFVYGYVYPPPCSEEGRFELRQGEHDVDQNSGSLLAVQDAFVVPIDDLSQRADDPGNPLPNDHVHLGTLGQLGLGRRMAEKMLATDLATAKTPSAEYPKVVTPSDANYRAHPDWNKLCEQRVAAFKDKPCDLIFIGDSITQNFDTAATPAWKLVGKPVWDKYYGTRNALCFGVGADQTQNVLWRLENMDVKALKPKVAIILIGINNYHDSAADITLGIECVLDKTIKTFKGVKIILVSVLPSNRGNEKYSEVNRAIATCADQRSVFYLDLYSKMTPVGDNFLGVGGDHVHLTPAGYELWASQMEPLLVKLLLTSK
jgi:lysophospholipase L1-like esterase